MSCPNATAPIDINGNMNAYCDLKCDYAFSYPISSMTVSNNSNYLALRFDKANNPPVRYNASNYEVTDARLFYPSLHTYSGWKAKAELIVTHHNTNGQGTLLVCIPIRVVENSTTDTVKLFDTILAQCAKTATTAGQQTVINIPTFTLNTFVPTKPFFSYTATLPYAPCNAEADYVVFSPDFGDTVSMSYDAYLALQKLIVKHPYRVIKSNDTALFMNKGGAKRKETNTGESNLYIECNPTGDDGAVLVPNNRTSAQLFNVTGLKALLQNVLFQAVAGVLIIIMMMKICTILLNKITGNTVVITRGILTDGQKMLPTIAKV